MKIRNGFVSNSSSSSFCIYGATIDYDDLRKAFEIEEGSDDDSGDIYELSERLEGYGDKKKQKKLPKGFEQHIPEGSDSVYIGRSWDSVGDNETGKEFKKNVEEALKEFFGKKIDCDTHAESWYS
jgi:hypothetical protein